MTTCLGKSCSFDLLCVSFVNVYHLYLCLFPFGFNTGMWILIVQSTFVISKSKGPPETLRDIRTSTYQICRIEENTNRKTKFHKRTCNLTPLVRKIC